MSQYATLIELTLFYGLALGFGVWALRANARAKRALEERRAREALAAPEACDDAEGGEARAEEQE